MSTTAPARTTRAQERAPERGPLRAPQRAPKRALRRRPAPDMGTFDAQVTRVEPLTPRMTRIAFGGPDLAGFKWDGPDQRAKLFLPRAGEERPDVPTGQDWYARYRAMPEETRPFLRTYTVRGHRPDRQEIEIDFVLHGDTGPASTWARRARPGDRVALFGPYADYDPTPDHDWQLIIGDETALPAIGGILAELPAGTSARVFLEVTDAGEWQRLDSPEDVDRPGDVQLSWTYRDRADTAGTMADAVRAADLPPGRPYVWLAGEAAMVRGLRRHLVRDRGFDRSSIYFAGYWRHGLTEETGACAAAEED